jgi:hypothetical protein
MQMLVKRVETGKRWVEEALSALANEMGVVLDSVSWVFCSSALAYRYYLIVRSGERSAAGEFSFILLEDCPKSRSLQRVLKANLGTLLETLEPAAQPTARYAMKGAA